MVSEFLIGIGLTVGLALIGILTGIIGWIVRQIWSIREDINRVSHSYEGTQAESGYLEESSNEFERVECRLDDIEDTLSYFERKREQSHEDLCGKIDSIVAVLEEEGFNGDLPDTNDE